jgi:hypothetical protein
VLVVNERQSSAFDTVCGLLIKCTEQIFTIIHGNRSDRVGEVGRSAGPGDGVVVRSHSGGGSSGRS